MLPAPCHVQTCLPLVVVGQESAMKNRDLPMRQKQALLSSTHLILRADVKLAGSTLPENVMGHLATLLTHHVDWKRDSINGAQFSAHPGQQRCQKQLVLQYSLHCLEKSELSLSPQFPCKSQLLYTIFSLCNLLHPVNRQGKNGTSQRLRGTK